MKVFIHSTLLLIIGNALCALAVNSILVPRDFLSSGLTGLSLIMYYRFHGLPVGLWYLIISAPVFILGIKLVNLRFVLYSAWGMVLYAGMLLIPIGQLPIRRALPMRFSMDLPHGGP